MSGDAARPGARIFRSRRDFGDAISCGEMDRCSGAEGLPLERGHSLEGAEPVEVVDEIAGGHSPETDHPPQESAPE